MHDGLRDIADLVIQDVAQFIDHPVGQIDQFRVQFLRVLRVICEFERIRNYVDDLPGLHLLEYRPAILGFKSQPGVSIRPAAARRLHIPQIPRGRAGRVVVLVPAKDKIDRRVGSELPGDPAGLLVREHDGGVALPVLLQRCGDRVDFVVVGADRVPGAGEELIFNTNAVVPRAG